jgi:hypothetical protein
MQHASLALRCRRILEADARYQAGPALTMRKTMRGPAILASTMSVATRRGHSTRAWQYHSRSDNHSKVACWTLLFDLLHECDALRRAAEEDRIGFRINHVMVGPINKTLDLVISLVPPGRPTDKRRSFADVAQAYGIVLTADERRALSALPRIEEDLRTDRRCPDRC